MKTDLHLSSYYQIHTDKMSTNAIVNIRNLDINRISFVQGTAKSGRIPSISIKYDGQNIGMRLPRLGFPFGLGVMDKDGPPSYSLTAPLKGCDPFCKERASENDDIGKFYNFLLDLQEKVVKEAVENSVKWFGKKRSVELIRESMKPIMRMHMTDVDGERVPSGKYPPNVTIKIPVYDNRVNVDIVDPRGNPMYVTPSSLAGVFTKGSEANVAVTASIYVMAGGGFGVTWRVSHAQVFQQARMTAASVFSDSITNEEDEETAPTQEATEPETLAVPQNSVEDETQDVPAPAPAASAPAKTGRRRAAGPV